MTTADEGLRALAAAGVLCAYLGLCAGTWRRQRLRRAEATRAAAALAPAAGDATPPVLVLHASQTGSAERLAWQTARALHGAGVPARIASLAQLGAEELRGAARALFIVSTYGEGDPPDAAAPFERRVMAAAPALDGLRYGVLALGDRGYRRFCGFGRALDDWLRAQAAAPLFERIEVDREDPAALARWQHELAHLAGRALAGWAAEADFEPWRLRQRRLLNPGSTGGPCFHVELVPPPGATLPDWQAGDLAQVQVPGAEARPRDYSIASLPADGALHLLVRQQRHADGRLGLASGWLTDGAAPGAEVSVRLRAHAGFRLGENADRPLLLIGNGTGLAGLRALLKARVAAGRGDHWLLFGERQAARDGLHREEIEGWRRAGLLERIDWVYSRDQAERRYVQHVLREQAQRLRDWVARGAAIYVCGSLQGMAAGVDAALAEALGREALEHLAETGRLRRDVY